MKLIPYVSEGDVSRWIGVLEDTESNIVDMINSGHLQGGRLLALHFRNSLVNGAISYALGRDSDLISCLNQGLTRFDYFFQDKFHAQTDEKYISETCEEALYCSLIVRSPTTNELIQKIIPFVVAKTSPRGHFVNVIISILARDLVRARKFLETSDDWTLMIENELKNALNAIVSNDMGAFLLALKRATFDFDQYVSTEARGTPEAVIFFRGAALIRLFEMFNTVTVPAHELDIRFVYF